MSPVLVTFIFISSLVEQCKQKKILPPSPLHLQVGGRAAANRSAAGAKAVTIFSRAAYGSAAKNHSWKSTLSRL
jgi:hypothetical protein